MGLGANNTVLAVGGIQAYLTGQPDVNFFNVTDAASPVWFASADPQLVRGWQAALWERLRLHCDVWEAQLPCALRWAGKIRLA